MAAFDDPSAERARRVQPIPLLAHPGATALEGIESTMDVPMQVRQNVLVTSLDKIVNWARKSSLWPMAFGLA